MIIVRGCLILAAIALVVPSFSRAAGSRDLEPVIVVTHLDIIPTFLDQELPVIQQFAADSKNDPGVRTFLLLTWTPAPNHFQLLEVYNSLQTFNNHIQAAHTIAFRKAIQPYIGSPYDERRYVNPDRDER